MHYSLEKYKLKTKRYHYITTRIFTIKILIIKSVVKNMEKQEPSYTDNENVKLYRHLGRCWHFSKD